MNAKPTATVDGVPLYPVPRTPTDFRYIDEGTKVYVTADGSRVYTQTPDDPEPRNRERFYDRRGYQHIHVKDQLRIAVHRLVCLAFHGVPPTDAHVVARRNGQRDDNHPTNLYWATRMETNRAAFERRRALTQPGQNADKMSAALVARLTEAREWERWYRDEPNPTLAEQWALKADALEREIAEREQKAQTR